VIFFLVTFGVFFFCFAIYFVFPHIFAKWKKIELNTLSNKKVALTFDDGPCPRMTYKILDLLDEYQIKATFFILGRRLEGREKILLEVIKRGHEIGGHGFGHLHYWKTPPWKTTKDIKQCWEALSPFVSMDSKPIPFRPPYGKLNLWTLAFLLRKKTPLIWWTVDSGDTWIPRPDPGRVGKILVQKGGGVALFHDLDRVNPQDEDWSMECLRKTIEIIRTKKPHWKIGTVSDLGLA